MFAQLSYSVVADADEIRTHDKCNPIWKSAKKTHRNSFPLRELQYQISLANRLGYLPTGTVLADDNSVLFETGRVLHGLIRSMRANSVREEAVSYEE